MPVCIIPGSDGQLSLNRRMPTSSETNLPPPQPSFGGRESRFLGREGLGEVQKHPLNHELERMTYKTSNLQVKPNSYMKTNY